MAPSRTPHSLRGTGQAHRAALTALETLLPSLETLLLFHSPDRPSPAGIPQLWDAPQVSEGSETRASSQVTFCSCHGTSGIFQQLHFLQMLLTAATQSHSRDAGPKFTP